MKVFFSKLRDCTQLFIINALSQQRSNCEWEFWVPVTSHDDGVHNTDTPLSLKL